PVISTRTASQRASIANARRRTIARQPGELELCREPLLRRRVPIDRNRLQARACPGVAFGELASPGVFLYRTLFRHLCWLRTAQLAKGMSRPLRRALASSSVLAVVTTTTFIPRTASTRS